MKKLLIFDFDGVLENTFELSFRFFKEQFTTLTRDEYRTWFDGNFYKVIKDKKIPIDINLYYAKYATALKERITTEEMKDVLVKLNQTFSLAIVSSSHDDAINEYLQRNKIEKLFDQVWGVKKHASKVEKLEGLITEHSVSKEDCWFVTDTLGDIRESNEVGIKAIAVTWGFHPKERLEQGHPAVIVDTPRELVDFLL